MTWPLGQPESVLGAWSCDEAWLDAVIAARGADWVLARISPYATPARRAKIDAVLAARVDSVAVAIEDPHDPRNVAAIVRTAEALGAGVVHVVAPASYAVLSPRVTRGAFYWASVAVHAGWDELAAALGPGVRLVAACAAAGEGIRPLAEVPVDRPLCLVFGNEGEGLSAASRRKCDLHFTIPMVGMSESLNVSAAAAIVLHDVLTRRRAQIGAPGDLAPGRREALRARWTSRSLDPRLLRALLQEGAP